MSLKTFHLIFITAATALALGCGLLGFKEYLTNEHGISALAGGGLGLLVAIALVRYERYFLKALKKVSYL